MSVTSAPWIKLLAGLLCVLGGVRAAKYQRFCYLDTAARTREGAGEFLINDLHDITLCTHLVFVNAVVDPVTADLAPALSDDTDYYYLVTGLKSSHPDLKVLLLVGGPDSQNSALFSEAVNSTDTLDRLAPNVYSYLAHFGFDGLELDWRYPGRYGSIPDDTYRYTLLIRKLSETFEKAAGTTGGRLMLNVRVSGDKDLLSASVQVEEIARYADYVVVTAYDFYVAEKVIGHNSGLFGRSEDSSFYSILNADYIIHYLTKYGGVSAGQIVMGIPTFGRSSVFSNDTEKQTFGAVHDGAGMPGPYTKQYGLLAYYEICSQLRNGWTEVMDGDQLTPFAFSAEEIVTYDNVDSIISKANYIKDNGLAGAALWDLSYDDFSGVFCDQGRFPLLSALKQTLISPRSQCPAGQRGELDIQGCLSCPLGTFQPSPGTMTCLSCLQGLTTLTTGTTHEYKCILPCPSGSEYNHVTSSCDPCPLGYYRKEGRDPACVKCAAGHTTVATNSADCVRRPAGVTEMTPRQINVMATVMFATMSCENKPVIVGAVRMLVADYFSRLAQLWSGLCDDTTCDNVMTDVTRGCEGGYSRKKRQAEEMLVVSIVVANVSEEVNNTLSTRQTQSVIAAALSERVEFQPLATYGIMFAKLDSLHTELVCDVGSAETNGRCEPCRAGSQHNTTIGSCSPCPVGHYQHLEGQAACWPCQGVMTTRTTGAASPDLCVSPCEARPNYCYNEGVCHWTEADRGTVYCECQHHYQGERCSTPSGTASARTGTVVAAVVGGVLAFLIIVLIIVACCVCFRVRRAVKLRHVAAERQNSVQSNNGNHYMTWGTFSKGSAGRGVKFVDYIDYYSWLSNVSEHQQGMPQQYSYRKSRGSQQSSPKTKVTTTGTTTSGEAQQQVSELTISNTNGGPAMTGVAETNIDAADKSDQDEHIY
ncbi:uncharacterized protein [Littorina saxatilis]|uniref:Chitinase n=1 Tax=Littorina saxatilis TaxID=31220 RepID=A0AAN9BWM1_9CAEN